jgi:opacity protein-like surface antigen
LRGIYLLLAAVIAFPVVAAAQGPTGAGVGSGNRSRSATSAYPYSDSSQWQLAVGYQYNRINLLGTPFNTNGINVTITRFFGRWFGLDGQLGAGLSGNTGTTTNPPNLGVHSLFVGGGPRLAFRGGGRIEPWVHFVAGLQDFHFTQTAGILGSNKAFGGMEGGGVDFALTQNVALRVEAETIETHFFSTYQRHFQVVSGLVFNF